MENISNVIGTTGSNDLPRRKSVDLIGKQFILHDAKMLLDFVGDYGTKDLVVLRMSDTELKPTFEWITSSKVIAQKAMQVKELDRFPVSVKVTQKQCKGGHYFDLE